MSYFPAFSCVALIKIYSTPYSVLICNNYKCYKLYRIYLYNFTQVRSTYAWKSHKYYIHHSNIIILGTRESEKTFRGEVRLEFFRGKIPSSEASSFPAPSCVATTWHFSQLMLCNTQSSDRFTQNHHGKITKMYNTVDLVLRHYFCSHDNVKCIT